MHFALLFCLLTCQAIICNRILCNYSIYKKQHIKHACNVTEDSDSRIWVPYALGDLISLVLRDITSDHKLW